MPKRLMGLCVGFLVLLVLSGCQPPPSLRLGVTTTLEDSGALAAIKTGFFNAHGVRISPVVLGSGQLLHAIEQGNVDIAITHAPKEEKLRLQRGSIRSRTPLFYNYFVLVGPKDNPAGIRSNMPLAAAFGMLATRGSVFVSRADNSGTYHAEQAIWQAANIDDTTTENSVSSQMTLINTGLGMGASLTIAAEQEAYILVDWATWLAFSNKQMLNIVAGAEGKEPLQRNTYSLLEAVVQAPSISKQKKNHRTLFSEWIQQQGLVQLTQLRIEKQATFFAAGDR